MIDDTPDPLEPAHIPGQNPNTPERLPGSAGRFRYGSKTGWIAVLIAALLIVGYFAILAGALSTSQEPVPAPSKSSTPT
jgi:hypothetical protein